MSVFIKRMIMPKRCDDCRLLHTKQSAADMRGEK